MPNIIEPPELKRGTCATCGNTDTVVAEGPNSVALCVDCVDCFAAVVTPLKVARFLSSREEREARKAKR